MTRRRDPCNVLIAGLMALFVIVMAVAMIAFPPKRPCKAGSLEQLFTNCEVQR